MSSGINNMQRFWLPSATYDSLAFIRETTLQEVLHPNLLSSKYFVYIIFISSNQHGPVKQGHKEDVKFAWEAFSKQTL